KAVDGIHDVTLESVKISNGSGSGIGVLAEIINKNSDRIGATASWKVESIGNQAVQSGTISDLNINGITIGTITDVRVGDADGKLLAAINNVKDQTGVEASIDQRGNLVLNSIDGRGIVVSASNGISIAGMSGGGEENYGKLTLTRMDARDIIISGTNVSGAGYHAAATVAETTINLRTIKGNFTVDQACAMGAHSYSSSSVLSANVATSGMGAGVTTMVGAQMVMAIADTSMKMLDKIRSDLGSVQNQLVATVNNISITQVNVKASESAIRDVDFAAESANFSKFNILAQSGSYAMSQASATQQNVLRLLQ
ncbi:MAG: flagellin B, partial [Campylobacterales bacterium]|nr:flagellin B [Campylobacterales bacterium]